MSGGDGYLTNSLYREIAKLMTDAGITFRVEQGAKHFHVKFWSCGREMTQILHLGPNHKGSTYRKTVIRFRKVVAAQRAWMEAQASAQEEIAVKPELPPQAVIPAEPSPSFDLALHVVDDEPRVLDTDLAAQLGIKALRQIRELIKRNLAEIGEHGGVVEHDTMVAGNKVKAFYLNEPQAVLVSILSKTDRAKQARTEVIRVFTAWRRGALVPAAPAIPGDQRHVIGGIMKGVVRAALNEMMAELLPSMVAAHLSKQNVMLRHGKTAGQIWDRHGLPKLKSAAKWLGNRLQEMGCLADGRGERGAVTVRLFDPDKAEIAFRNGLLLRARQYVAERQGQGRLRLLPLA